GVPTLTALTEARFCGTLRLQVDGLPPGRRGVMLFGTTASWQGVPLPVPIPGTSGCMLHVSPDVAISIPTGSAGQVAFSLSVPTLPALLGSEIGVQYAVIDQGANALGV